MVRVVLDLFIVFNLAFCFECVDAAGEEYDCSTHVTQECKVVHSSECHGFLSSVAEDTKTFQEKAVSSFLNLTLMVDSSVPNHQRRSLRMELTDWWASDQPQPQEMLIYLTPSNGSTEWSTCLKVSRPNKNLESMKEECLSTLIQIHSNITSYRMVFMTSSRYNDRSGDSSVDKMEYLITLSDLTTSRAWILPAVAFTKLNNNKRLVFSITPPTGFQHLITCSTWLITCGASRQDQLLVAPEGIDPGAASRRVLQGEDAWGMGACVPYVDEMLLNSSKKFPHLDMKVPSGKYQIWIDCVLDNSRNTWHHTKETIRTPTFTYPGDSQFTIAIHWNDRINRQKSPNSNYHASQTSEYSNYALSDSTRVSNPALGDKDKDGNTVVIAGCVTGVALLFLVIASLVTYKAIKIKRRQRLRETSRDEQTSLSPLPPTFLSPNHSHHGGLLDTPLNTHCCGDNRSHRNLHTNINSMEYNESDCHYDIDDDVGKLKKFEFSSKSQPQQFSANFNNSPCFNDYSTDFSRHGFDVRKKNYREHDFIGKTILQEASKNPKTFAWKQKHRKHKSTKKDNSSVLRHYTNYHQLSPVTDKRDLTSSCHNHNARIDSIDSQHGSVFSNSVHNYLNCRGQENDRLQVDENRLDECVSIGESIAC